MAQFTHSKKHANQALYLLLPCGLVAIGFFYLALIRPFYSGFDLTSIETGAGIQVSSLINSEYRVTNQLLGLHALVLSGEFSGSEARATAISQLEGQDLPFLVEFNLNGQDGTALMIGLARPGPDGQGYETDAGFTAVQGQEHVITEQLKVDLDEGTVEAIGQTDVELGNSSIRTETGLKADEGGNFELR